MDYMDPDVHCPQKDFNDFWQYNINFLPVSPERCVGFIAISQNKT